MFLDVRNPEHHSKAFHAKVVCLDTGRVLSEELDMVWANDETGEYGVYGRERPQDGKWPIETRSGRIKIIVPDEGGEQ